MLPLASMLTVEGIPQILPPLLLHNFPSFFTISCFPTEAPEMFLQFLEKLLVQLRMTEETVTGLSGLPYKFI